MKIRTILLPTLALLAFLAMAPHASAELAHLLDPGPNGPNPSVEAIVAEDDVVYTARADGWITAILRNNTGFAWEWHGDAVHPGPLTILDMVDDSDNLYVVLSDGARPGEAPVVALNKTDGSVVWVSDDAWDEAGYDWLAFDTPWDAELDPFRIAIDLKDPDAAEALYVGTDHGFIVKLDKSTGGPVISDVDGQPMFFQPSDPDTDSTVNITKHLSAVFAVQVYDDNVFASRRFGGILVGTTNQWGPYLFTHKDNVFYWLDGETLTGQEELQLLNFQTVPQNTSAPIYPGINDFWIDGDPDGTLHVYAAAAADADAGLFYYLRMRGDPTSPFWDPTDPAFMEHHNAATTWEADVSRARPDLELGEGTLAWAITGDDDYVYGLTFENMSMDLNTGNNGQDGWLVKFDRQDLALVTDQDGWVRDGVNGRTFHQGRALALDIHAGSDAVFVGHGDTASGFPAIASADPNVPALQHVAGALVVEVPRDGAPAAVMLRPWGYEFYGNTAAFAFFTDRPGTTVGTPGMEVDYFIRSADCPAAQSGCWQEMDQIYQLNPGNVYVQDNNVELLVPDGKYRVKVKITDALGRTYEDESDHDFTVDKTPPVIEGFAPLDGTLITTCQPVFSLTGHDETSGVDMGASFLFIDVRETAYPYLIAQRDQDLRVTGYTLDMTALSPTQKNPPGCLGQGPHLVHAEMVDRAGNFAFREWTIHVDSTVEKPSWNPPDRTWVKTDKPTLKAQFREDLRIRSATFDGQDVTSAVRLIPQHPSLNPQGARVEFTPATPLPSGRTYTLSLEMVDDHGNVGGPFSASVRVDTKAPTFTDLRPAPGSVVAQGRPSISATISELGGSQLITDDVQVFVDGFLVDARIQTTGITFDPIVPLASGTHNVRVTATDVAGNHAEVAWDFRVDLETPGLDMALELPEGQKAVRVGDQVRITLRAEDQTALSSIRVDPRGLDSTLSSAEEIPQVPGEIGVYERVFEVKETSSKQVVVTATAVDSGGLKTTRQAPLLIDNRPPIAYMHDLPQRVGASFQVSWENNPRDDQNGGSGVAYYILQQSVDGGATWTTIRSHHETESTHVTYPESEARVIGFRVKAVDHAGNVQPSWSGVVQTEAVGDPFSEILYPTRTEAGKLASFTVTPRDAFAGDANATVAVVLEKGEQSMLVPLDRVGALYTGKQNLTGLEAGTYLVRFHFTGSDGVQTVSRTQYMTVEPAVEAPLEEPVQGKQSPGVALIMLIGAMAGLALARRSRR